MRMNNPKFPVSRGQTPSNFASRLLAGLNFNFEDYRPLLLPILRTNWKHRIAWVLTELSLDIITKPFFQACWPTVQIEGRLSEHISYGLKRMSIFKIKK